MNENIPLVTIIILNWNGAKDTAECIQSLSAIDYKNYEILIIDNNSCDEDKFVINGLKDRYKFNIQISDSNLGFSGGNNLGILQALSNNSDYILLLNNDTIVQPDFLTVLVKKISDNENIGIAAPQINYFSKKNMIWSAGGKISKLRASGFALSDKDEMTIKKVDRYVQFSSGCCLLIKAEVFQIVGFLDENYFLYVEDTDFCYRTVKAHYKILITHDTKIFHKVSRTSTKHSSVLPLYYSTRNRLLFSKKNFKSFFFFSFVYITFSMVVKFLFWFFFGETKKIHAVVEGFLDFFSSRYGQKLKMNEMSID